MLEPKMIAEDFSNCPEVFLAECYSNERANDNTNTNMETLSLKFPEVIEFPTVLMTIRDNSQ